ncbi:hypothetical protein [Variovorax arabinosiphilus]|uniref:hypothetical protein n=1 Tax=Variovorax arabinosiphilus TaxID=3053498 RepID=UPI00257789A2|nr:MULTISPECIES: hypothetical protein [unclassified Variovorax]MDM0118873.1 hypothetical protein [Variovorax sp. J2L1-78]MDM0129298.1 hypothetical protein [Variovorax sp. J2L1-63]MDM0232915.1 hypothetical protein [Variovorax sp. J2R1-6]
MPSAIEFAQGDPALIAAVRRSRKLVARKALLAAAASAVPLPGIDWAADAALLSRLVPQISAEFGLSVTQVETMAPQQRERIQKAATTVGALLVGRLVTRDLLMALAKHAGLRLTTKQATKYVPVAGQIVSAGLGYAALRALGEQHIKDCVKVARAVQFALPSTPDQTQIGGENPETKRPQFWKRLGFLHQK